MKFLKQQPVLATIVIFASIWAIAFWPARKMSAESGVLWLTVACLIIAAPALVILAWERMRPASDSMVAMGGQMVIRLVSMMVAVLVVKYQFPEVTFGLFYGWLLLFYCAALAVEAFVLQDRMRGVKTSLSSFEGVSD